jgi:hypothetical protein
VLCASLLSVGCDARVVIGFDDPSAPDAAIDQPDSEADALDAESEPLDASSADASSLSDAGVTITDATLRGPFSRLPWVSGAHYTHELSGYSEFASWRGRPVDVAHLYVDRNSWQGLVSPGWPLDLFTAFPGKLVLSEPLYPLKLGNNKDCATGAYDEQWKKLGTFLVDRDRADTIIRLGWGHNDDTHYWRADADPSDWIACFRRVVNAIRSSDRAVRIDWTFDPIASDTPNARDPYAAYPGDEYVDIVGMDDFDRYPATHDETSFRQKCESKLGLCRLAEFARSHKKQLSVGEWGVVTCGADPGGDNPLYIRQMVQHFSEYADILAYESYYDEAAGNVCSTLISGERPNAAAEYKRLYAR